MFLIKGLLNFQPFCQSCLEQHLKEDVAGLKIKLVEAEGRMQEVREDFEVSGVVQHLRFQTSAFKPHTASPCSVDAGDLGQEGRSVVGGANPTAEAGEGDLQERALLPSHFRPFALRLGRLRPGLAEVGRGGRGRGGRERAGDAPLLPQLRLPEPILRPGGAGDRPAGAGGRAPAQAAAEAPAAAGRQTAAAILHFQARSDMKSDRATIMPY